MNIDRVINDILNPDHPRIKLTDEEMEIFSRYAKYSGFDIQVAQNNDIIFTGIASNVGMQLEFKNNHDNESVYYYLRQKSFGIVSFDEKYNLSFACHTDTDIPAEITYNNHYGDIITFKYLKHGNIFRENNKPYLIQKIGDAKSEVFLANGRKIYLRRIYYNGIRTKIDIQINAKKINLENIKQIIERANYFSMDDLYNIENFLTQDEVNLISMMLL